MKIVNWIIGFSLIVFMAGCAGSPCQPCPAGPTVEVLVAPIAPITPPPADDLIVCPADKSPQIPDRLMAKLFDTAVNTGVSRATKLLQESLNDLRPDAGLALDGALGPKTRAALCGLSEEAVLMIFVEKQSAFYQSIVQKNPSQAKFLKGWLRRAAWLPDRDQHRQTRLPVAFDRNLADHHRRTGDPVE